VKGEGREGEWEEGREEEWEEGKVGEGGRYVVWRVKLAGWAEPGGAVEFRGGEMGA